MCDLYVFTSYHDVCAVTHYTCATSHYMWAMNQYICTWIYQYMCTWIYQYMCTSIYQYMCNSVYQYMCTWQSCANVATYKSEMTFNTSAMTHYKCAMSYSTRAITHCMRAMSHYMCAMNYSMCAWLSSWNEANITRTYASCHIQVTNAACHTYKWVILHRWTSHDKTKKTNEKIKNHLQPSHLSVAPIVDVHACVCVSVCECVRMHVCGWQREMETAKEYIYMCVCFCIYINV